MFTTKDTLFKSKGLLSEVKELLTEQVNLHVKEEEKLAVFNQSSVYLSTKKIGKYNPQAEEIRADNEAQQDWSRNTALALVVGIPEETVLKIKHFGGYTYSSRRAFMHPAAVAYKLRA